MSAETVATDLEQQSKDRFFERLAEIGQEMTVAHGRDFSIGAFVLAARWFADKKPLEPGAAPAN